MMYQVRIQVYCDESPDRVTWILPEWSRDAAAVVLDDVENRLTAAEAADCHPWDITARGDQVIDGEVVTIPAESKLCSTTMNESDLRSYRHVLRQVGP